MSDDPAATAPGQPTRSRCLIMVAHTVQRLRFELDVGTVAQAHAMQESISAFRATELEPILDTCLSGLVSDDRFLRLDTVELDLGSLPLQGMASELAPRIESALSRAVTSSLRAIGDASRDIREQSVPLSTERLRQLERFLERGTLSWSAGCRTLGLNALLDSLIDTVPDALRRSLEGRDHHAARCKRLAAQFSRVTLGRLLQMLLRERAGIALACIDALVRIHRHKPLVAAGASQFETALWTTVLDLMLSHRRAIFDETAFLQRLVRGLADHFRVASRALAAGLLARMEFLTFEFRVKSLLRRSLSPLAGSRCDRPVARATQDRDDERRSHTTGRSALPQPGNEVAVLVYFLQQGCLPVSNHALALGPSEQWLKAMPRDGPNGLVAALKRIGDRPDVVRRLVASFDWDALSELIQALEPDYAGFILTYLLAGERFAAHRPGMRMSHWCAALGLLLDPHGPRFEMASFVRESSYRSARRLNMSHEEYLEGLLACVVTASRVEERFAPLQELLSAGLDEVRGTMPGAKTAGGFADHPGDDALPAMDPAPLSRSSRDELQDTVFLTRYFLRYGKLPRHADAIQMNELHGRIAATLASRRRPMQAMLVAAAAEPLARARMAVLFPPALMDAVIGTLISDAAPLVSRLLASLGGRRREIATELLLASIAGQPGRRRDPVEISKLVLKQLARAESVSYPDLLARLRRSRNRRARDAGEEIDTLFDRLNASASADWPLDASEPPDVDAETATEPITWTFPRDEPSYVDNAGMILLWPFLGRYFETLGMLDGGEFRDPACRHRAVYLLQFLTSGSVDGAEYTLLLNKILCGIDPGVPLASCIEVTETETQLSLDLLHGVCQNWPPLRNTSTQGLREAFLCREGRLQFKGESWSLAVSEKSYDVLLDSLPWNLSMIRLSWMKHVLHAEWR